MRYGYSAGKKNNQIYSAHTAQWHYKKKILPIVNSIHVVQHFQIVLFFSSAYSCCFFAPRHGCRPLISFGQVFSSIHLLKRTRTNEIIALRCQLNERFNKSSNKIVDIIFRHICSFPAHVIRFTGVRHSFIFFSETCEKISTFLWSSVKSSVFKCWKLAFHKKTAQIDGQNKIKSTKCIFQKKKFVCRTVKMTLPNKPTKKNVLKWNSVGTSPIWSPFVQMEKYWLTSLVPLNLSRTTTNNLIPNASGAPAIVF